MEAAHETYKTVPSSWGSQIGSWNALQTSDANTKLFVRGDSQVDATGNHTLEIQGVGPAIANSSMYLDGTNSTWFYAADSADWNMSNGLFAIDFKVMFPELSTSLGESFDFFYQGHSGTGEVVCRLAWNGSAWQFDFRSVNSGGTYDWRLQPIWTDVTTNKLYHVHSTRGWASDSNTIAITIDGVELGKDDTLGAGDIWDDWDGAFQIGGSTPGGTREYYMKWYRVTKGAVLWTANFDVPIGPCKVV